jgi:predicted ArsR family transcriptional regulator
MTLPKKSRAKTSEGKIKRIMRYASSVHAISTKEIAKRYGITPRQALRYIDKLFNDGRIYMRYKVGPRYYYSVVRRKREVRETK